MTATEALVSRTSGSVAAKVVDQILSPQTACSGAAAKTPKTENSKWSVMTPTTDMRIMLNVYVMLKFILIIKKPHESKKENNMKKREKGKKKVIPAPC